ncbi:hypothetical protein LOTGIDRAFT_186411, partial [Lottia gigantea]
MDRKTLSSSQDGTDSFIKKRTTVINRGRPSSGSYGFNRSSSSGMGGMGFGGIALASGTYAKLSQDGVTDMKGKRESEKKELQTLNERLGSYIEKVRFLEALNTQLEEELEIYRNQKAVDFKPVKAMYESELEQARKVIDELSAEKGVGDAKIAGFQDLVDSLKQELATLEGHNADYRQQIESQTSEIGGYEGELATLRLRIQNLENENDKLRQINTQRTEENARLRADLDNETAAHIDADCRATTLEEEVEFLRALLDKMPSEPKQAIKIKGLDVQEFWQNNLSKAIRDIQNEYDTKLDLMRQDCETRFAAQMRQVQSGAVRDNMENKQAKEVSKKLQSQLQGSSSKVAEMEAKNGALQAEMSQLRNMIQGLETELESEKSEHMASKSRLQAELEACVEELRLIMDAKLSLELEISCYRKLLEGEENRL